MPKITEYKLSAELNAETVPARDFERFVSGLEVEEEYTRANGYSRLIETGKLIWRPEFPAYRPMCSTTITEEADCLSNMEAIENAFKENGSELGGYHASGEYAINATDTHALALACSLESFGKEFVILDDQLQAEKQTELEQEAYDEYGRNELVEKLFEHEQLAFIFDLEEEVILPEFEPILDPILREIASYAVSYSGEMYFGEDTLRSAIADLTGLYMSRDRLPALITALAMLITVRKAHADREAFESAGNQPLSGLEVY